MDNNIKYCWSCGKENEDTNRYCYHCGKPLNIGTNESETVTTVLPSQKPVKYILTLADKEATASLVLSIMGTLAFWALPLQILALVLGIRGYKAERRRSLALVGIGFAIFGILCFITLTLIVAFNYEAIINSELFTEIYYAIS